MQSGSTIQQLYMFRQDRAQDQWELCLSNVDWSFYDANGGPVVKHEWHLEVGLHIDIPVGDNVNATVSLTEPSRVTLAAGTGVYALKFLSPAALQTFMTEYSAKLSENTAGTDHDDYGKDQVISARVTCSKVHACCVSAWHSLLQCCVKIKLSSGWELCVIIQISKQISIAASRH